MNEESKPIEAAQAGGNGGAAQGMKEADRQALIDAHVKRQIRTVRRVVVIAGAFLIYTVWFMLHQ